MARRRGWSLNTFGLAFLDVMSCGLGAAVLIFLIVDHSLTERAEAAESGELERAAAGAGRRGRRRTDPDAPPAGEAAGAGAARTGGAADGRDPRPSRTRGRPAGGNRYRGADREAAGARARGRRGAQEPAIAGARAGGAAAVRRGLSGRGPAHPGAGRPLGEHDRTAASPPRCATSTCRRSGAGRR